jgi:hypothetical protein
MLVLQRISAPLGEALMSGTYRDDLDATLRRADELEREVAKLRARNQQLEALRRGDSSEAPAESQPRPTVLVATRGGRLATSLTIAACGMLIVANMFVAGITAGAIIVGIVFAAAVAWLNTIPRVDPPSRPR